MIVRRLAALLALLALSACATQEPAPVTYRGSTPDRAAPPVAAAPAPSVQTAPIAPAPASPAPATGGGVVDYGGYKAVVARQGDTLASMASRAGVSDGELAAYNGIPAGWSPRVGDELILPPGAGPSAALATPAAPIRTANAASAPARLDLDRLEQSLGAGEDHAASTPEAVASGRAASVPGARPAAPARVAAPAPAPTQTARATPSPTPAPSASRPAAPARSATLARPVEGKLVSGFRAAGSRGDGVEFAAAAGAPVRAAEAGAVALISDSLGGLGTIVLLRHPGDLLTVYGKVDGVTVKQGDRVSRGQRIGAVASGAAGQRPGLHFEVRKGATAVDPANYL